MYSWYCTFYRVGKMCNILHPLYLQNSFTALKSFVLHLFISSLTTTLWQSRFFFFNYFHVCVHAYLLQLCPVLCDAMNHGLPGSSVHGILQGEEDPWRNAGQSTPVFLPGESRGQRRLMGYSLWGCKESDMTEATLHAQYSPCR